MSIRIVKRDGSYCEYDPSRINTFVGYVCEDIDNVSMSDVVMNAGIKIVDGIKTTDINKVLIQSAEDLISVDTPNYDLVAGRMLISEIRKSAYGIFEPPSLYEIISDNVRLGKYDPLLLEHFTEEEIDELDAYICHDRDFNISIAGAREWSDKYLIKDRITGVFYESPQVAYMVGAMANFMFDDGNEKYTRLDLIKKRYDHLSLGYWNCPTPQIAGLRTTTRTYSSCVLIETDDSIDGIGATEYAAKRYAALKAGLGIGSHNLRARGRPIRAGEAINTGVLSHSKSIEESALSCSQGGLRKGSLTFNWSGWHLDYDNIVRFKNNARLDSDSMKHSDHSIQMNGHMLRRVLRDEDIFLFSPEEVPDLKDKFYSSDIDGFAELYEKYSKEGQIEKRVIPGREWFNTYISERFGTGRIYAFFTDNVNKYGPFIEEKAPIRFSNLCQEITQHTEPLKFVHAEDGKFDMDGLIALCNLGGINWGAIEHKEEFEEIAEIGVRALDNILSMQYYPFEAARKHNDMYRPIGIGITGLAYWLAKNNLKYDNCYELLDEWTDYWAYSITKASIGLAKGRGACGAIANTKWSQGLFTVDYVAPATNNIVVHQVREHWEQLRPDLIKYGIRNATLMAIMPSECEVGTNKVLMDDNSQKTIYEILEEHLPEYRGIETLGIPERFEVSPFKLKGGRTVYSVYYNGFRDVYSIEFEDNFLAEYTENHLFMIRAGDVVDWRRIDQLKAGDVAVGIDGKELRVIEVFKTMPKHTWGLSTEDERYYAGNGLLMHNTSAKVSGRGTTNGVEPIRALITSKGGKSSKAKFVAPGLPNLKDKYDLVWDWTNCSGLIKTYAIIQKYVDQAISANTYYNKSNYEGGKIPLRVVAQDFFDHYSYGGKTLYYNNNNDDNKSLIEFNPVDATPRIEEVQGSQSSDEEYCESCTL